MYDGPPQEEIAFYSLLNWEPVEYVPHSIQHMRELGHTGQELGDAIYGLSIFHINKMLSFLNLLIINIEFF